MTSMISDSVILLLRARSSRLRSFGAVSEAIVEHARELGAYEDDLPEILGMVWGRWVAEVRDWKKGKEK